MYLSPDRSLVTPLSDPELALRREILVTGLFKYVAEIQELEDGYAFKFRRSGLLNRRIEDYLLFEGLHAPQLTFALIEESNEGALWLQVRGSVSAKAKATTGYVPNHPLMPSPA
ncbi:MAG: hypothetical protein Q8L77_03960 [Nitrospirota bacterium]|nr:hypothetical protein [Nitrospirota bacterium]